MATPNAYSIQLITTLLEDSATVLSSPGSEGTGSLSEAFGGLPNTLAGGASDVNLKLGMLTDPKWLAIFGDDGITFKISNGGDAISASPFAFLADVQDGLGISEIWLSNDDAEAHEVTVLAAE